MVTNDRRPSAWRTNDLLVAGDLQPTTDGFLCCNISAIACRITITPAIHRRIKLDSRNPGQALFGSSVENKYNEIAMSLHPACINLENGLMLVATIVGPWWVATDNRVQKKNIVVPRWSRRSLYSLRSLDHAGFPLFSENPELVAGPTNIARGFVTDKRRVAAWTYFLVY